MRNLRWWIASLLFGALLGVGSSFVLGYVSAERSCPRGQAPATNPAVTGRCFDSDATLPKGYTWDPGGNR